MYLSIKQKTKYYLRLITNCSSESNMYNHQQQQQPQQKPRKKSYNKVDYSGNDRTELRGYNTFSYSTQLSMKLFLLINIKMPTIVGILIFISWKNFMLNTAVH